MNDLLKFIGDALDTVLDNIIFLIIALNIMGRLFKKKTDDLQTSHEPSEEWWREAVEEMERSERKEQASTEYQESEYQAEYQAEYQVPEDGFEQFKREFEVSQSGDWQQPQSFSESSHELDSLIKTLLETTAIKCREFGEILNSVQIHPQQESLLITLIPRLIELHQRYTNTHAQCLKDQKALERSHAEQATRELLIEIRQFSESLDDLIEFAELIDQLFRIFTNDLERFELAHRLLRDQLSPFVDHRHAEGIDLKQYPIPAPLAIRRVERLLKNYSSIGISFFPSNYEALDDLKTWPLKARSGAHILFKIAPQWSQELFGVHQDRRRSQSLPRLPRQSRGHINWDLEEILNAWGKQLFGPLLGVLRYGPAMLEALLIEAESLAQRGERHDLILVASDSQRRRHLSEHAPLWFESEVAIATLTLIGFEREADYLRARRRQVMGDELSVTLANGKLVPVPTEQLRPVVREWCSRLLNQRWSTWNDEKLSDIVGLICTRGTWALAQKHGLQIAEGEKVSQVPDHIHWLTVIHIAQQHEHYIDQARQLTERYLRHHHHRDHQGSSRGSSEFTYAGITQEDLVSAIVLADLFERRSPSSRPQLRRALSY